MSCRGVHFAITADQAEQLLSADDDDALLQSVEEIEEEWSSAFETDKAWDALHRCLSNGTLRSDEGEGEGDGEPPLNKAFFGGKTLNEEDDYFVVLLTAPEVVEVAAALAKVTEPWLRARYFDMPFPDYQGEKSDDDWDYSWSNFEGLPAFFARAATEGRHVIFTVSQ